MKLIISGSRSITNYYALITAIAYSPYLPLLTEIVSGTAHGADLLGERYAREQKIPLSRFPARWDLYDKRAGMIRNGEMAAYADALLALWDKSSRGTTNMIDTMRSMNKPYFVYCPGHITAGEACTFSGNLSTLLTFPITKVN